MQEPKIVAWKLSVTWSDGKVEGLASCLPEYLDEELSIYFQELEDLRAELSDVDNEEDEYWMEDDLQKQRGA